MTDPRAFEEAVARRLEADGYATELGPYRGDWGVDIFATRGSERLAVQVKMYGGSPRPVNRKMVFELHGAAAYFDCTGSIIATDGRVLPDAEDAAAKLGVRLMRLGEHAVDADPVVLPAPALESGPDFETIWERSVIPLAGRTLTLRNGEMNQIVAVDWSGVTRVTSNGRRGHIPIEIFRWTVERVLSTGQVSRAEVNEQYVGRASSGVALVLAQVPEFEVGGYPTVIRLRTGAGKPEMSRG